MLFSLPKCSSLHLYLTINSTLSSPKCRVKFPQNFPFSAHRTDHSILAMSTEFYGYFYHGSHVDVYLSTSTK